MDLSGTMYGDEAMFGCDNGFTVAGPNTSECQANGEWSGDIPYCVPETCTTCKFSLPTAERRQSNLNALNNPRTWIILARNSAFDCHLSPNGN